MEEEDDILDLEDPGTNVGDEDDDDDEDFILKEKESQLRKGVILGFQEQFPDDFVMCDVRHYENNINQQTGLYEEVLLREITDCVFSHEKETNCFDIYDGEVNSNESKPIYHFSITDIQKCDYFSNPSSLSEGMIPTISLWFSIQNEIGGVKYVKLEIEFQRHEFFRKVLMIIHNVRPFKLPKFIEDPIFDSEDESEEREDCQSHEGEEREEEMESNVELIEKSENLPSFNFSFHKMD